MCSPGFHCCRVPFLLNVAQPGNIVTHRIRSPAHQFGRHLLILAIELKSTPRRINSPPYSVTGTLLVARRQLRLEHHSPPIVCPWRVRWLHTAGFRAEGVLQQLTCTNQCPHRPGRYHARPGLRAWQRGAQYGRGGEEGESV